MLVFVALVKNVCNMDIHFDWQACDSSVKMCVSLRCESILLFKGKKNTFEILDFQLSHATIHPSISFLFSKPRCQKAFGIAVATDSNKAPSWRHVQLQAQEHLFLYTCWFSCAAWTLFFIFELFPCTNYLLYLCNTRQERYHTPHLPWWPQESMWTCRTKPKFKSWTPCSQP